MPFSDPPVGALTLPEGAGPADPRIVLGDEIPAELAAYYAGFAETVRSAILYYVDSDKYLYEASTTNDGGDRYRNAVCRGMVLAGVVREASRYAFRSGIGDYYPSLQVGLRDANASFVQWQGEFLLSRDAAANIDAPLTISYTTRLGIMGVLSRSTAQAIANSVSGAPLVFDTIEYDPFGMAALSGGGPNLSGFTAPFTGFYAVHGTCVYPSNSTGVRAWTIRRNSTFGTEFKVGALAASHPGFVHDPAVFYSAGDLININTFHTAGVTLNVTGARMSVRLVSLS